MTTWTGPKAFMSTFGGPFWATSSRLLHLHGWDTFCLRRTQDILPSSTKVRSFQSQNLGRTMKAERRGRANSSTWCQVPAVFKGWEADHWPGKGPEGNCTEKQRDQMLELVQMPLGGLSRAGRQERAVWMLGRRFGGRSGHCNCSRPRLVSTTPQGEDTTSPPPTNPFPSSPRRGEVLLV